MTPTPQPEDGQSHRLTSFGLSLKRLLHFVRLTPRRIAQVVRTALSKSGRAFGNGLAAQSGSPPIPTLLDIANTTDSLFAFEVRHGCFGGVELRLEEVRKTILENRVGSSSAIAESDLVERLWINLLRLGLFDELLHLIDQHNLTLRSEVKTFIDFCAFEYVSSKRRGEIYRTKHPDSDIFTMGCTVWGDEYVGNFLRYNFRSMLSENNLPALRAQGQVVCSIITDAAGERHIRRDAVFGELADVADVEFTIIPDEMIRTLSSGHLVRNFYIFYGMLDHCSIYFAQGAASHLFMIPVDSIVADGSLNNMANYRHEGYECCGGGNIVANTETFLPALDMRYGKDGPISISTEDLATLAVEHAHHYFISQIVAAENKDFGKHPRELFWPVDGGVEIHSVFIHPLFTTASGLANYRRKHFANIDYGMIPRMFSDASRIKIVEDPRQAYVNNFTAAGRLYETTGGPFAIADFLRSHDYSYPVQKSLFTRAQFLPCRVKNGTPYRDVTEDVRDINAQFEISESVDNKNVLGADTELTIILATHNRSDLCRVQIHFLQGCGIRHRVVVADSSDQPDDGLRQACTGLIEYRHFPPTTPLGTKFAAVAHSIATPYVATITDDDISFPHTIDAGLDYLRRNPDYVVAQGYVLGFGMTANCVDIHKVQWFVGGTAESTPLRRLYELMRRYQPFFWAVFRTEAFVRAIEATNAAKGIIFQELAFTATIALLGNSARLPMIQMLRGEEESHTPTAESHPFFWFLNDTQSFFAGYTRYRDGLFHLLEELKTGRGQHDPNDSIHTIDIIHASYFGRELDMGMVNHTARVLLGDALEPVRLPKPTPHAPGLGEGDMLHRSSRSGRDYLWRSAVVNAEPRSEIEISPEEIARVEAELDEYLAPITSTSEVPKPLIARDVTQ